MHINSLILSFNQLNQAQKSSGFLQIVSGDKRLKKSSQSYFLCCYDQIKEVYFVLECFQHCYGSFEKNQLILFGKSDAYTPMSIEFR